jgi:hypothetical protein
VIGRVAKKGASLDSESVRPPGSIAGWEQGFTILSMERWVPFLGDMGIPAAIVAAPEAARDEARTFLRRSLNDRRDTAAISQRRLMEAIDRLAAYYGRAPVDAFAVWIRRFIVDGATSQWLSNWRELLRIACGLLTTDQPVEPLPADIEARVCDAVATFLDPAQLKATAKAVRAAGRLPPSAWEQELEDLVREHAGVGPSLGAVEMSADLVRLAVVDRRTLSAHEALASALSAPERDALLGWAHRQRHTAGLPAVSWQPPSPDAFPDTSYPQ